MRPTFRFLFAASFSLALALTFSCSGDDGGNGEPSSSSIGGDFSGDGSEPLKLMRVYALGSISGNSFEYFYPEDYSCSVGGVLEKDNIPYEMSYSIRDNVLALQNESWGDTLNFAGTSNNLIGAWTRTKNDKNSACEYDPEDDWMDCKDGFDIVKAEFTEDTLKFTYDFCFADEIVDGSYSENGWRLRNIKCNSFEEYKGTEKITTKAVLLAGESALHINLDLHVSYNDKTCIISQHRNVSQQRKACEDAWEKIVQEEANPNYYLRYYEDFYYGAWEDCLRSILPPDYFTEDEIASSAMLMKKIPSPSSRRPSI